ncbi:dihydropyrimidinase [Thermanaeromonas toyohensis ToBE]|uniref:Dihydropyrimidinase n=1 Tax=Thermanaeromonas toyohensis ToBE TaxID=698762 RepID=A0A1W1W251_9FIRM|nr:dihydropyrimidinase [Thermanaeromonas toyohensis]SMB99550.1 dihydropyrimidinase [Thermanaeromonas toyohensis ToBE]
MAWLIKGGWVVTAEKVEQADLLIEGDKIVARGPGLTAASAEVLDARGKYILPGIIDAHVHYQMPIGNLWTADDFYTGTVVAACGGVTTVIDYAEPTRSEDRLEEVIEHRLREAKDKVAVDFSLHLVLLPGHEDDKKALQAAVDRGLVSFKVFTTYNQRLSYEAIGKCIQNAKKLGALVTVHAEDHDLVMSARKKLEAEKRTSAHYHALSRPPEAEIEAVRRLLHIAKECQAPLYFVHVSTGGAAELIAGVRKEGLKVFGETCPHYLLLTEEVYATKDAPLYLMCPPLRKEQDNRKLWQALAEGHLQVVATDHCSYTPEQKAAGTSFWDTPAGVPGTETLLPLLYSYGVREGWLSLPQLVQVLSTNPARLFGLYPRKGDLNPGSDADIVIFDPRRELQLNAKVLHSAAGYTPFAGHTLKGYPEATFLRGELIYYQGRFLGRPGQGQFIPGKRH